MQIGCHGLVWTGTFDATGIRDAARRTRAAGFDLLELPLMDPAGVDVTALTQAIAEHGLGLTGSLGLSPSTDVTSPDPAVSSAGERLLETAVDVLAEAGGTDLTGVIYSAMCKYMAPATVSGRAQSQEILSRVAERGRAAGVRVHIEITNRYETNIANTAHEGLTYLDAVGHDNLGLHLDTYHMNIEETDMWQPVIEAGSRLQYVHIGESHRGYLGTGSVDFDTLFRALVHSGYDGPIVFESFSSAVVDPDLSKMLGIWRNLWTDGDDLGAHACRFIRDHLSALRA